MPYFEAKGLGAVIWNSGVLMTQIQWFLGLGSFFCNSTKECKEFFAKSLFVVGEFGGSDYNAPLFAGKGLEEAYKLRPDAIQSISDDIEALIAEGAVELIVPGVMPTRCFPVYLNMLDEPSGRYGSSSRCVRWVNTFSWVHSAHLKAALEKLRVEHPSVRMIYGDYYTPVIQFMLQPEKFVYAGSNVLNRIGLQLFGKMPTQAYNTSVLRKFPVNKLLQRKLLIQSGNQLLVHMIHKTKEILRWNYGSDEKGSNYANFCPLKLHKKEP